MFMSQSGLSKALKCSNHNHRQDMKSFWLQQALKESQSPFVRPSCPSLSEALDLHLLDSLSLGAYIYRVTINERHNVFNCDPILSPADFLSLLGLSRYGPFDNKTKYFRLRRYDKVRLLSFSLIAL